MRIWLLFVSTTIASVILSPLRSAAARELPDPVPVVMTPVGLKPVPNIFLLIETRFPVLSRAIKSVRPSPLISPKAKPTKLFRPVEYLAVVNNAPVLLPEITTKDPAGPVVTVAASAFPSRLKSAAINPVMGDPMDIDVPAVNVPSPSPKTD